MQKDGTTKPPAGTTALCLHCASGAPASMITCTPGGNGNGANPPTLRVPLPLVVVIRTASQHGAIDVLVVELDDVEVVVTIVEDVEVDEVLLDEEVEVDEVLLDEDVEVLLDEDVELLLDVVVELLVVLVLACVEVVVDSVVDVVVTVCAVVEVVDDVEVVLVTQWQVSSQTKPPPALPVHEPANAGSHSSPASIMPLPHVGVVDVVVVLLVLVDVEVLSAVVDVVLLELVVVLASVVEVVDDVEVLGGTQWQVSSHTKPPVALPVQLGCAVAGSHSSPASTVPLPHSGGVVEVVVELLVLVDVLVDAVVVDVVLLELVDGVLVEVVLVEVVATVDVVDAIVELVVLTVGAVDVVLLVVVVVVGHAPTRGTQRRISSSRSLRLSVAIANTWMRFWPYFLPPRVSGTENGLYSGHELAAPVESGAVMLPPLFMMGFRLSAPFEQPGDSPFVHTRMRKVQPLPH